MGVRPPWSPVAHQVPHAAPFHSISELPPSPPNGGIRFDLVVCVKLVRGPAPSALNGSKRSAT